MNILLFYFFVSANAYSILTNQVKRKCNTVCHSSLSNLGTPSEKPMNGKYNTKGNILVDCQISDIKNANSVIDNLITTLDDTKGIFLITRY